ncbi:hypothetical protein PFICI_07228 [Pestalotiopsis fici W106-1]|uniref:SNF2 N-terminal domain-containing protein n=1 Tax=Pestalotiopsis fici (strain W106-1 / CGMCC3.15140) TaxID=1229662 RepID=W3XAR2_PESFW|nr:uncharacterized protein PFICI_07228 [Pestalotiopsis fici W106-1]ETS82226.1 hypothetical protein PFICI_07228 [Pestalotiopsis fici W106-1]
MEEDPNGEVMTTDSTGSQRPEDGTQLPGQSATTEMATSCDGATDTPKPIKEEFQSQMMPPSKRTAADASNMDTNGRQFKKARVEEIVDQVVGADVMETDPVGDDQQVDLQPPTEITNGIKRAESQQDMENTKGHYNTTMSQPDAGSDERQVNKPKSSNKGISDSEARQVTIKQEVDDTVEAGTNDNLNQINEQNSVQNSNSDNCIPEALVEETKEHPEIEMMDVDAANDHRQADVRQLESTSSEKPAEKTGEASNITERRENIHNKDRTAKVSDIVIKQECDANIAEEALNNAPNQTQDQHGAPVHYSDNLTKEARVEEVFPEPPYSNRSNSKNNKVRADAGMQQLPHKRDNRRVLNKSNAANPPQSCGAGDEKNITEIDPFKIKGATKEKQFVAFREAADPSCPKNQVSRDIADINAGLKSFGKREFVGYQDKWHHRTLNFGLYNDQMIGVARMKELEKSGMGGLLADQMGFGKTAQIIALIVTTPAPMQQLGASSGTKGISYVNSNRQDDSNDGNNDDADEDEIDHDDDEDICPLSHCTLIIGPPRSSKQLLHECKRFIKPGKKVSITPYARKHENDGFDLNIYDRSDFM